MFDDSEMREPSLCFYLFRFLLELYNENYGSSIEKDFLDELKNKYKRSV